MNALKMAILVACILVLTACATNPIAKLPSLDSKKDDPTVVLNARGVPSHYKVKRGETVSSIAMRYRLNWREVAKLNNLDSKYTIHTGQWLTLWQVPNEQPKTISTPMLQQATSPVVKQTVAMPASQFIYPVPKSSAIIRQFGVSNDSNIKSEGVWFRSEENTPVVAVADGRVSFVDESNAHGIFVHIRHADGLVSEYRFVQQLSVEPNQIVRSGQRIATTKKTNSGAVITEFRLSKHGVYIDPMTVLR